MTTITFKPKKYFNESIKCGFEYSLLDDTYTAYHAPIQCKDYFSDLFWCEYMRKAESVYGFGWTPGVVKLDQSWYHMGLVHSGYPDFGKYVGPVEAVLQEFDSALGFGMSRVEPANENRALLVKFSGDWTKKPMLISAFSQIVRLAPSYAGGGVRSWLKDMNKTFVLYDECGISETRRRLLAMLEGKLPEQTYQQYGRAVDVHFLGGLRSVSWKELAKARSTSGSE